MSKIENYTCILADVFAIIKVQGLSFREYLLLETGRSIDPISMDDLLEKHLQIVEDWQVGPTIRP